mmetsp:Transcript_5857/g.8940  ORF Transcript_5857/g.8940 Transcript_5857/m.8940 type:complete len:150 (-) Transcript_5857:1-450(-)
MAGWAYSNFGDDQQAAQDDQLRQTEARGQLQMMMREAEVNEFRKAKATSPTLPSLGGGVVPLKAVASKERLPAKKKPTLTVPAWVKKRSSEEESGSPPKRCKAEGAAPSPAEGSSNATPATPSDTPAVPAPLAALIGYADSDSDADGDV